MILLKTLHIKENVLNPQYLSVILKMSHTSSSDLCRKFTDFLQSLLVAWQPHSDNNTPGSHCTQLAVFIIQFLYQLKEQDITC